MQCFGHLLLSEMAKGHWNVSGAITNPEGMGAYISAAESYLASYGARFLCRDLHTDVRQGNAGDLIVITPLTHQRRRRGGRTSFQFCCNRDRR